MTNKKGMTLVEVLVYIVLAGMLLAPVIMLVQNSSVSMARDASNTNLRMSGREILNIIYDDLKNTGYKLNPKLNTFEADTAVSYVNLNDYHQYVAACTASSHPASTSYGPCPPRLGSRLGTGIDSVINGKFDISSFMPANKFNGDYYDKLTVRMGRLKADGAWADTIDTVTYFVDNNKEKELKRTIQGKSNKTPNKPDTMTLARNVAALKFRYSEDLVDWYDRFDHSNTTHVSTKGYVQYIKVIIVTKDNKKLAPSNPAKPITLINSGDAVTGYYTGALPLMVTPTDASLYERHEVVVPIPNNGLFP